MIPKLRRLVLVVLLLPSVTHAQDGALLTVTGRVSPAFQIEPVSAFSRTGAILSFEQQGAAETRVVFNAEKIPGNQAHEAVVIVALRTNASNYRVMARSFNPQDNIDLSLRPMARTGTGTMVSSSALADFRSVKEESISTEAKVVATGTRISMGGRFPSADNAILVEIRVAFSGQEQGAFALRLGF